MYKMTKTTFAVKVDEKTGMKMLSELKMKPQRIITPMKMTLSLATCLPWLMRNIVLYEALLCIQKPSSYFRKPLANSQV